MDFETISGTIILVGVILGIILYLMTVIFKKHVNIMKWCGLLLVADGFVVVTLFVITLFVVHPKV